MTDHPQPVSSLPLHATFVPVDMCNPSHLVLGYGLCLVLDASSCYDSHMSVSYLNSGLCCVLACDSAILLRLDICASR